MLLLFCYCYWDRYAHGERIDRPASFYAGDAAGRPNAAGWKKDHGDGDLKFAINAGLPFKTPEVRLHVFVMSGGRWFDTFLFK